MIDCFGFYAISVIFQPCIGGNILRVCQCCHVRCHRVRCFAWAEKVWYKTYMYNMFKGNILNGTYPIITCHERPRLIQRLPVSFLCVWSEGCLYWISYCTLESCKRWTGMLVGLAFMLLASCLNLEIALFCPVSILTDTSQQSMSISRNTNCVTAMIVFFSFRETPMLSQIRLKTSKLSLHIPDFGGPINRKSSNTWMMRGIWPFGEDDRFFIHSKPVEFFIKHHKNVN